MTIQNVDFSGWPFFSHPVIHKPRIRFTGCSPNFHDRRSKLFRGGAVVAIMMAGLAAPPVDARLNLPDQFLSQRQTTGHRLVAPINRHQSALKARRMPARDQPFLFPIALSAVRPALSLGLASGDVPSPQESSSSTGRDGNGVEQEENGSTDDSQVPDATAPATKPPCPRSAKARMSQSRSPAEPPISPPAAPPQPIITLRRIILLGVLAAGFGLLAFVRR